MKAVLISIQPKYCKLIANGQKTIEVRKTRPKLETPFKCYIYCTKGEASLVYSKDKEDVAWNKPYTDKDRVWTTHSKRLRKYCKYREVNGKVIGEFMCDLISNFNINGLYLWGIKEGFLNDSCLTETELTKYIGEKIGFIWHISDLKIYDNPKELSKFCRFISKKDLEEGNYDCDSEIPCSACCYDEYVAIGCEECIECVHGGRKPLNRAPKSWCYVEELGGC